MANASEDASCNIMGATGMLLQSVLGFLAFCTLICNVQCSCVTDGIHRQTFSRKTSQGLEDLVPGNVSPNLTLKTEIGRFQATDRCRGHSLSQRRHSLYPNWWRLRCVCMVRRFDLILSNSHEGMSSRSSSMSVWACWYHVWCFLASITTSSVRAKQ